MDAGVEAKFFAPLANAETPSLLTGLPVINVLYDLIRVPMKD
jgi:hypothetical protein